MIAGEPAAFDKAAIPAVVFTVPQIGLAGLTADQAKCAKAARLKSLNTPGKRAVSAGCRNGRTDGLDEADRRPGDRARLLGCGIVGAGAGELIAEAVLAIEMGCTARDLAESVHPHPTLSETVGFSAEAQLGYATEIYRPKRKQTQEN